jgi:hypothetical protein
VRSISPRSSSRRSASGSGDLLADHVGVRRARGERGEHRRYQHVDLPHRLADLAEIFLGRLAPVVEVERHQIRNDRAGHEIDAAARRGHHSQLAGRDRGIELAALHPGTPRARRDVNIRPAERA